MAVVQTFLVINRLRPEAYYGEKERKGERDMKILVTGGAGYIGSHTCVQLLENNDEVVVIDNLYNSCEEALNRVEEITGKTLTFYEGDLLDQARLEEIFKRKTGGGHSFCRI